MPSWQLDSKMHLSINSVSLLFFFFDSWLAKEVKASRATFYFGAPALFMLSETQGKRLKLWLLSGLGTAKTGKRDFSFNVGGREIKWQSESTNSKAWTLKMSLPINCEEDGILIKHCPVFARLVLLPLHLGGKGWFLRASLQRLPRRKNKMLPSWLLLSH